MLKFNGAVLQWVFGVVLTGGAFAVTPINGVTDFGTDSITLATGSASGAGLQATNVFGYDFRLTTKTSDALGIYLGDEAYPGQHSGVQYYPDTVAVVSMLAFAVSANNHDTFDMQSVDMTITDMNGTSSSTTVVMTGYRDGVAVPGATASLVVPLQSGATTSLANFDVSGNAAFHGIDEFRLSPGAGQEIGYFGIDNLNATNFQPIPEPASFALAGSFLLFAGFRRRR
jgi:hypothetical protein